MFSPRSLVSLYRGFGAAGVVASNPGVFEKGEMALPKRARALAAEFNDAPAEDALRCVQPRAYLPVLRKVPDVYSSQAAS